MVFKKLHWMYLSIKKRVTKGYEMRGNSDITNGTVYLYYRVLYTSLCNQPINIHWSFLPFPPHSTHCLLVYSGVPITVKHNQPRSTNSIKTKKKTEKNVKKVKKLRKENKVKKFKKGKKKKDSCNFCLYS